MAAILLVLFPLLLIFDTRVATAVLVVAVLLLIRKP
jgi:hypothetical protein